MRETQFVVCTATQQVARTVDMLISTHGIKCMDAGLIMIALHTPMLCTIVKPDHVLSPRACCAPKVAIYIYYMHCKILAKY